MNHHFFIVDLCGAKGQSQGFLPAIQTLRQVNSIPSLPNYLLKLIRVSRVQDKMCLFFV